MMGSILENLGKLCVTKWSVIMDIVEDVGSYVWGMEI